MPRARNHVPVGARFGFLAVVAEVDPEPRAYGGGTMRRFLMRCICGSTSIVYYRNIHRGSTRSCGRFDCISARTLRAARGPGGQFTIPQAKTA